MHEHVFIDARSRWREGDSDLPAAATRPFESWMNGLARWSSHVVRDNLAIDPADDFELAVAEVAAYARAAGPSACLVDLTTVGISPAPEALAEVSLRTGVHLVAGTGFYVHSTHPAWVCEAGVDELTSYLVTEVDEGIRGTGIRAGVIGELGTSEQIEPCERRVLQAAAAASEATGCSVNVHCHPAERSVTHDILDALLGAGLPPSRVYLSHLDEIDDIDYVISVLERGVVVGFDSFGQEGYFGPTWAARTDQAKSESLMACLAAGHGDQLVLSQDVCKKQHLGQRGGLGYDHVTLRVVPRLREHYSMSDQDLHRILVGTPRRLLDLAETRTLTGT